jgi:hypothetical protein
LPPATTAPSPTAAAAAGAGAGAGAATTAIDTSTVTASPFAHKACYLCPEAIDADGARNLVTELQQPALARIRPGERCAAQLAPGAAALEAKARGELSSACVPRLVEHREI